MQANMDPAFSGANSGTNPIGFCKNFSNQYQTTSTMSLRSIHDLGIPDFLLSECNVVTLDDRYLRKIPDEEYQKMDRSLYIQISRVKSNYRRLATILPLYTSEKLVVPIPCIIDTGAPTTIVLGLAALRALQVQGSVRGDVMMALRGIIKNNNELKNPFITQLPNHYENRNTMHLDSSQVFMQLKCLC